MANTKKIEDKLERKKVKRTARKKAAPKAQHHWRCRQCARLSDAARQYTYKNAGIEIWRGNQKLTSVASTQDLRHLFRNCASIEIVKEKGRVKEKCFWSETKQNEFCKLKHHLCSAPVLTLPDLQQPFEIEIDARQQQDRRGERREDD